MQTGQERTLFWIAIACITISLTTSTSWAQVAFQISFPVPGPYVISLPGTVSNPVLNNAEDLLSALGTSGTQVGQWDTASQAWRTWNGSVCGGAGPAPNIASCSSSCFCVQPSLGEGYQVIVSAISHLTVNGVDPPGTANLVAGTNAISVPFNTPLTDADALLMDIDQGTGAVVSVSRLDPPTGGLVTWTGFTGTNFSITPGEGYFVTLSQNLQYPPNFTAPTLTARFPSGCLPRTDYISLPVNMIAPVITDETQLLNALNALRPIATSVARRDPGPGGQLITWDGVNCSPAPQGGACTAACFCVTPADGTAYQVSVTSPGMLVMTATDGPITANLLAGNNEIALPHNSNLTNAAALIASINTAAGALVVSSVSTLDPASCGLVTWTGTVGTNFPILPGQGYVASLTAPVSGYSPGFLGSYIAGSVFDWRDSMTGVEPTSNPVPSVAVNLTVGATLFDTTGTQGEFLFNNLQSAAYTVTPTRVGGTAGAISITDALVTAQVAVGIVTPTPNQLVAGDVTAGCLPLIPPQCVTGFDASTIARFAAGLITAFPVTTLTGSAWFFDPQPLQTVPGQMSITPNPALGIYQAAITYSSLPNPVSGQYFLGGVWGDIQGDIPAPIVGPPSIENGGTDSVPEPSKPAAASARLSGPAATAVLSIPTDAGGLPGTTAVVPVKIEAAAGTLAVDMLMTYDPAVLTATAVASTPFTAGYQVVENLTVPGEIRLAIFGTNGLFGDGDLVEITFDVIGVLQDQSGLNFTWAFLDEGQIAAATQDGAFCAEGAIAEVQNLILEPQTPGSTVADLNWTGQTFAATYNVYRGQLQDASDMTCFAPGLTSTSTVDDGQVPGPGSVLYYLVTAVNCRGETTVGPNRPAPAFCP